MASWPNEKTPSSMVHDKVCDHCLGEFKGYASSKYCSPNCAEMAERARKMLAWGVPARLIGELTGAADTFTHGWYGYNHMGCRCPVCREANSEKGRRYRARKEDDATERLRRRLKGVKR